jgi:hypothetical protein
MSFGVACYDGVGLQSYHCANGNLHDAGVDIEMLVTAKALPVSCALCRLGKFKNLSAN